MLGINMNFHVKDWWAQNRSTGKAKGKNLHSIFFLDQSIIYSCVSIYVANIPAHMRIYIITHIYIYYIINDHRPRPPSFALLPNS